MCLGRSEVLQVDGKKPDCCSCRIPGPDAGVRHRAPAVAVAVRIFLALSGKAKLDEHLRVVVEEGAQALSIALDPRKTLLAVRLSGS